MSLLLLESLNEIHGKKMINLTNQSIHKFKNVHVDFIATFAVLIYLKILEIMFFKQKKKSPMVTYKQALSNIYLSTAIPLGQCKAIVKI